VNLVRNSLQAGATSVQLSLETADTTARAYITDNGGGIPLEVQSRIFEPNFSTKTSGMGLGLAISRRIVEGTGGSISFTSSPNGGTTFMLEFPLLA
jgi:two-component system, NtrC family, nitrogen regulation sensor histidine kinase NtrY